LTSSMVRPTCRMATAGIRGGHTASLLVKSVGAAGFEPATARV
jgi:hypothetical protein